MRRRLLALAAAVAAVGGGATALTAPHQPAQPAGHVWVSPIKPATDPAPSEPSHLSHARQGKRHTANGVRYSLQSVPCISTDCGPYAAALHWSLGSWGHTTTGYYVYLNTTTLGSQVDDVTSNTYVFPGGDCATTATLGVRQHDGSGNTGPLYTSSYTTPVCPSSFSDEFTGTSLDTSKWVAVDNTIGNTNSFQCDHASQVSEGGGLLTETIAAGSNTCAGPVGGNGGITSCPGGTCTAAYQTGEVQTRDFAFKYGTVTVAATMSGGNSVWPAIWLLGYNCQHPQYLVAGNDPPTCSWHSTGSEELDMPDWPGGTTGANGGHWNEFVNSGSGGCNPSGQVDPKTAQHVYSMTWTASSVSFAVDGTTLSGCTTTTLIPSAPEFLIIDNAMNAASNPTKNDLTVDYVRINANGPNQITAPSISGSTTHGSVLTANHGTWTGSPTGYTYQWMQCNSSGLACSQISGATSSTYTTVSGDVGHEIQVLVQATNASGVVQEGSAPTAAIS